MKILLIILLLFQVPQVSLRAKILSVRDAWELDYRKLGEPDHNGHRFSPEQRKVRAAAEAALDAKYSAQLIGFVKQADPHLKDEPPGFAKAQAGKVLNRSDVDRITDYLETLIARAKK